MAYLKAAGDARVTLLGPARFRNSEV